jgi:SAM domain (Sterile alpha motif)
LSSSGALRQFDGLSGRWVNSPLTGCRISLNVDIVVWLRSLGLEQYEAAFRENAIDVSVLPDLTDQDLEKLGLLLGHRRKLLRAIAFGCRLAVVGGHHVVPDERVLLCKHGLLR